MQRPGLASLACLLTLLALWMTPAGRLHAAAPPGYSCTASMTPLNFGNVDPVNNIGLTATASLSYTCTNTSNSTQSTTVCFSIGDPNGLNINPRWLNNGSNKLNFQMYQDAARTTIWGSKYNSASMQPYKILVSVPANSSVSNTLPLYGAIVASQNVPAGTYSANYGGNNTEIELGSTCGDANPAVSTFGFTISATVANACTVTAGPTLQLGSASGVDAGSTNVGGSNTIQVSCTKNAVYNVGLQPSNGNTNGAGVMAGSGGNTDTVPYQLRRTSVTGPVWGNNNVSASSTGNGVAGTGNGSAQSITVYAVAPTTDFRPDTYSDTVTIYVYY